MDIRHEQTEYYRGPDGKTTLYRHRLVGPQGEGEWTEYGALAVLPTDDPNRVWVAATRYYAGTLPVGRPMLLTLNPEGEQGR